MIYTGTVTSSAPIVINIPSGLQVRHHDYSNRQKGVHIFSTGNEPIFVISETFISFLNHGTFVAYPCSRFKNETSYEYYVISTGEHAGYFVSEFLLVGCENETTVTITPSKQVHLPENLQEPNSPFMGIDSGSTSHLLKLHRMQTLLVTNGDDLTGTKITSNKPLTVISGHECANVPVSMPGCEPLAVQVPPVATWGKKFLLAPFAGRMSNQTFKAISSEYNASFISICGINSTQVTHKITVFSLNTEEYCYLESTVPILVIQLSAGVTTDNKGDPAITMISPIDQYLHEIEFISLPTSDFPFSFISVTVSAEHYSPESILLDGTAINCDWQRIYDIDDNVVGFGCSKALSIETSVPTQHTVSHLGTGGLLSVLVYGFNSAGPARGYAYLTGQKLKISTESDSEGKIFSCMHVPSSPSLYIC